MEKKIYERQMLKQGMSLRVVDEQHGVTQAEQTLAWDGTVDTRRRKTTDPDLGPNCPGWHPSDHDSERT